MQEGARETVAQCRIGQLFDDSKFLSTPALRALVLAVAAAASPRGAAERSSLRDGDGSDLELHDPPGAMFYLTCNCSISPPTNSP